MTVRDFDPRRLDMRAFAQAAGTLAGEWSASAFRRLAEFTAPDCSLSEVPVGWSARGYEVPVRTGAPEVWLHLTGTMAPSFVCQRCLQPVVLPQTVDRPFQFAPDEERAAMLDADADHDVLALDRDLDLQTLLEDEFLLELPIVPRHEVCPEPLPQGEQTSAEAGDAHPFAALAALKKGQT
jgi:uncharacterized protein